MINFIRRHPLGTGLGAVAAIALGAWLAFGYFGVHTLFIDDVVDEAGPTFDAPANPPDASPTTAPPATTVPADTTDTTGTETTGTGTETTETTAAAVEPAPTTTAPAEPEIVTEASGTFESLGRYSTSGDALVLGNGTGQRFLRFENFETTNGPDLNVYLVNSSTGDVSDYVDLGDLSGNIGNQNYEIPTDVDLAVYDQVMIWCVRFGTGFGQAALG